MALNPQLLPHTPMPVPFVNEIFVLAREGVEFEVDKIPLDGGHGGKVKARGTVFLSNIRMVFVAGKPVGGFVAFDMPLVVPDGQPRVLYSTHTVKILFKEGGCGTFVPLFLNLIASARQYSQFAAAAQAADAAAPRVDPLQASATPVADMMRHAYVDPSDPSKIFLQQPTVESQLRRRSYHPQPPENSI